MEACLSLGSNIGDRLGNLVDARGRMAALKELDVLVSSPAYETDPVDVPREFMDSSFLNAVIAVEYAGTAEELSDAIHEIEAEMGRERGGVRNAPRVIDIDLISFGNEVRNSRDLTLPHPRWMIRRFVVQPLYDIRKDLVLPEAGISVNDVLLSLPKEPKVVVFSMDW